MKLTLSWLKEYLETNAGIDEITETLTDIGLEVEEVQNKAAELSPFVVAEIMATEKHPDADKLQICKVLTMAGERVIVCGAPNARAGIKVALADIGCIIPNGGFKIKQAKIRGVESSGMMCSASELGLGDDHAGIIELPESAVIGESIVSVLGLDDVMIEIAITPNRADALGVYGIARDLAAAGIGTLKTPDFSSVEGSGKSAINVQLETDDCKHFVGRTITGLKNCDSPNWLQQHLKSVGLRPISALVDITNYITHAFGRPLHVYDIAKLKGDIIVRSSKDGEYLEALNDKAYNLPDGLCVIADELDNVLGLGGVVGGVNSGCVAETSDIFLESAWFEPDAIAKTGRKLQVDSDARYRFERTVDPEFTTIGAEIATRLIIDICGTDKTKISELTIAGDVPDITNNIEFSPSIVQKLGGVEIDNSEIKSILQSLGFVVSGSGDKWQVKTPSFRPGMELPADLLEEILRIKRYSAITELALPEMQGKLEQNTHEQRARLIRRALANRGMQGVVHFAFNNRKESDDFIPVNQEVNLVEVQNPISSELSTMRTNLLPHLLSALERNIARNANNIALFEFGNVFFGATPEAQPTMATGVRTGNKSPLSWNVKDEKVDVFDVKADLFALLDKMGLDTNKLKITTDVPSWYHPGKAGRVSLGGKITLGYFGMLHPATLRAANLEQDVAAFELHVENVPTPRKKASHEAVKTSDFQSSVRDFAFVVDESLPAGDLISALRSAEKKLVKDVTLFDVYSGKGVAEGKKSLAISVTLQADNRTLSEDDLTRVSDAMIAAATRKNAVLR